MFSIELKINPWTNYDFTSSNVNDLWSYYTFCGVRVKPVTFKAMRDGYYYDCCECTKWVAALSEAKDIDGVVYAKDLLWYRRNNKPLFLQAFAMGKNERLGLKSPICELKTETVDYILKIFHSEYRPYMQYQLPIEYRTSF